MIRASVIVPMRNASAWIEECLDALQRQEFPGGDYEIIVVDNCSSDDSASRVQQRPQITLLDEPVPGSYAARNRGIRAASGDVIAFIDADCVAQPGWLT
jgi:glycosyltransferase involved in cell wall biosynthesis